MRKTGRNADSRYSNAYVLHLRDRTCFRRSATGRLYLGTSLPVQAGLVSGHGNPTIQGKMPEGIDFDLREFGFAIFIYEADILSDIHPHLLQPFGSVCISRFCCRIGKDRPGIEFSCFHEGIELFAYFRIGNDRVGGDDSGNVESLARSHESNAAIGGCLRNRCKRMMRILRISHLCMYFIGDNEYIVFGTNLSQLDQCVFFQTTPPGL